MTPRIGSELPISGEEIRALRESIREGKSWPSAVQGSRLMDALDYARAENSRLEAEVAALRSTNHAKCTAPPRCHLCEQIESLRAEVARLAINSQHDDDLAKRQSNAIGDWVVKHDQLRAQLAEAQKDARASVAGEADLARRCDALSRELNEARRLSGFDHWSQHAIDLQTRLAEAQKVNADLGAQLAEAKNDAASRPASWDLVRIPENKLTSAIAEHNAEIERLRKSCTERFDHLYYLEKEANEVAAELRKPRPGLSLYEVADRLEAAANGEIRPHPLLQIIDDVREEGGLPRIYGTEAVADQCDHKIVDVNSNTQEETSMTSYQLISQIEIELIQCMNNEKTRDLALSEISKLVENYEIMVTDANRYEIDDLDAEKARILIELESVRNKLKSALTDRDTARDETKKLKVVLSEIKRWADNFVAT